jgi:hypothetical protein
VTTFGLRTSPIFRQTWLKAYRLLFGIYTALGSVNVYLALVNSMKTKKIDRTVKMQAVILDAKGQTTQDEVATIMKMGKRTLQRAKQKFKEHGDVEGGTKQRGRPPTIHHSVRRVCILLLGSLRQNLPFSDFVGPS